MPFKKHLERRLKQTVEAYTRKNNPGNGFQSQAGREGDTIRVGGLEIRKQR